MFCITIIIPLRLLHNTSKVYDYLKVVILQIFFYSFVILLVVFIYSFAAVYLKNIIS